MTTGSVTDQGPIELGILNERTPLGSHIAYLWETTKEFEAAVGFLELGLRQGDHLVVFGHDDANARVLDILAKHGRDPDALRSSGALAVLGPGATAEETLEAMDRTFATGLERGGHTIRLLGNIGWGAAGWPVKHDLFRFEAQVTEAARRFPCVIVCMYEVQAISGEILVHGCFDSHPLTIYGNRIRANPFWRHPEASSPPKSGFRPG